MFERKTVAKDHELLTEALRHGRGSVHLNELRGTYELEVSRGKLLHVGGNVATEHSLERERSMVAAVDRGIGRYAALGGDEKLSISGGLREEQRRAVEAILESRDLAINLRGAAGTGKTATLREVHRGLNHAGHEVLAVAPTRSAVEELHKVGFRDAMTITRLMEDETAPATARERARRG